MLLPLILFCTITGVNGQVIINKPRHTAALTGSNVTLECIYSGIPEYVRWQEYITTTTGASIFSGSTMNENHPRRSRYKVVPFLGRYNLEIRSFRAEDAGYYTCSGNHHEDPKYGAFTMQLSSKVCTTSQRGTKVNAVAEGDHFSLTCQRNYSSIPQWLPILHWTGYDTDRTVITSNSIQSEVDMQAEESMDGNTYNCTTAFSYPPPFNPPDPSFEDDTRLPVFTEAACETTLHVHWGAKNFHIEPNSNSFRVGDEIKCSASANPRPTRYAWKRLFSSVVHEVEGHVLPVTRTMAGGSFTYECAVTNMVTGSARTRTHRLSFYVSSVSGGPKSVYSAHLTILVSSLIVMRILGYLDCT